MPGVQVLHLPSEYDHPTLEDPSLSVSGLDFNVHGDEEAPESLQGCALNPPLSMLAVACSVEDRFVFRQSEIGSIHVNVCVCVCVCVFMCVSIHVCGCGRTRVRERGGGRGAGGDKKRERA
jgi:hypothetical protein